MRLNSFTQLAEAMGIKAKVVKPEKVLKCPKCGDPMRHISGTNIWLCEHVGLEDDVTPEGVQCQVIRRCGDRVFA